VNALTEVIPLEGIDLNGVPPCQHKIPYPLNCRQPSKVRIRTTCSSCGDSGIYFTCSTCYLNMTTGNALCGACFAPRGADGCC
jgi:hypothetical protein